VSSSSAQRPRSKKALCNFAPVVSAVVRSSVVRRPPVGRGGPGRSLVAHHVMERAIQELVEGHRRIRGTQRRPMVHPRRAARRFSVLVDPALVDPATSIYTLYESRCHGEAKEVSIGRNRSGSTL
jgi:hypothetical protein